MDEDFVPDANPMDMIMKSLQERIKKSTDEDYELVDYMNEEEVKLFNESKIAGREAEKKVAEANTKRKLFWATVEAKRSLFNEDLIIDEGLTAIKKRKTK